MTSPRKEHPLTGQRTQTARQEARAGHRARLGSGGAAGSGERVARAWQGPVTEGSRGRAGSQLRLRRLRMSLASESR